jgi:hypothetical protein
MAIVPIVVGIDDFGTGTSSCIGWTFFLVPELYASAFENEARAILQPPALDVFHGKEYKRRFEAEYKAFLELISETIYKSLQCTAIHVLYRKDSLQELQQQWNRIVKDTIQASKIENDDVFDQLQPFLDPLFTLMQACSHVGPYSTIRAVIDDNNKRSDLTSINLKAGDQTVTASTILRPILNGWRQKNFPRTPEWTRPPVGVKRATDSMVIQAADVIANFSLAYAQAKLGRITKSSEAKVKLIQDAFGKSMGPFPFTELLELTDDGFAPKEKGAVKWCMGWQPVTEKMDAKEPT